MRCGSHMEITLDASMNTARRARPSGIAAGVKGRRFVTLLTLAFVAAQLGAVTAHANIVYTINTTITSSNPTGNAAQTDTVLGTLTTDGQIGVLSSSDIISYDLDLIDQLNAANNVDLTPANSSIVENTGSALSASATGLSFNFSGSGEFGIQANSPGPFSGYSYFCFSTGVYACLAGETISPQYVYNDGVVATGAAAPVGTQPLDQAPSAMPEPATLSLLGLGLAGVGFTKRRKKMSSREHEKTGG
jgi:hypothetical protein